MVDPRDFGAVPDGLTDCSEALQRCADAGGAIGLAAGCYRITRPIVFELSLHGPASLTGRGCATILNAGPGPALRFTGSHHGTADPSSVTPLTYAHERLPHIADLELVGEHPEADGIELNRCLKPLLTGLLIRRCGVGIHLVELNRDVLIDHCQVYDNRRQGIFLDQVNLHQINICDCHISYNQAGGIVVMGSEIRNLQISGCDIEYNCDRERRTEASADVWVETRGKSLREGAIVGCTIQAVPSAGGANIRFIGESDEVAHKVGLFSITGNLISSQETQIHLRYARGVTIAGNTFFSGHQRSIVVEDSSRVVIGSNVFDHNPDYAKETLDGIRLTRVRGAILTGNQLSDILHPDGTIEVVDSREVSIGDCQILEPARYGVRVTGSTNVRVASCTIVDAREPNTMEHAVLFDRVAGCQVCDCRLDPGLKGAIEVTEGEVPGQANNLNGQPS